MQATEITKKLTMESDYLVYCMSTFYNYRLFDDFESDACVIIKDIDEFIIRIKKCLENRKTFSCWNLFHNIISYYDPCTSQLTKENITIPFMKEIKYKFEREYRFVLIPDKPQKSLEPVLLNIGSLKDICEIVFIE